VKRGLQLHAGVVALAAAIAAFARLYGADPAPQITFRDVTAAAGIDFRHDNAASPDKYLIETMGSGVAWIDYDGDGRLDLYFGNSAATNAYKPSRPLRSALYRNNGDGTFTDITNNAGVGAEGVFVMGIVVGDYDNDGDQDLYVIGYQRSILYRNEGNGHFSDVTEQAHAANRGAWGSSGAFFDYDKDGFLDLVIANYVDWSPDRNLYCGENRPGYRSYCHPNKHGPRAPTLLHNKGDGTFEDVTAQSGLAKKPGNGLGVVTFDYNGDGWQDIFVANDSMPNSLFRNQGDGTFEEVGLAAGVAVSENGESEAGMGVDAADYDGDGLPDLFVTHLDFELNRLYRNSKAATFDDVTVGSGLAYQAFRLSGFGARFIDYDNDGLRDLFIANGHVLDNIQLFHPKTTFAEPKLVFRNSGGRFENVTGQLGSDLGIPQPSRAAAFGDYDNDGDIDVVVGNNGQAPQLLRNDGGNRNHWIQIRLAGVKSNRDGVGAVVTVRAGSLTSVDERKGGMSYQSAHDPRLHFGLGLRNRIDALDVVWPSGVIDHLGPGVADRVIVVREGSGAAGGK
jgi:enediyne biosynthesis protein E4